MKHIYHVQEQTVKYHQHIPHIPHDVSIAQHLRLGLAEPEFLQAFQEYVAIIKRMYMDMEKRPAEYGLLLVDIHQVNENKAEGNLAKASWRSVKRLGDFVLEMGRLGQLKDGLLSIEIAPFKVAIKKLKQSHLLFDRMMDFGFVFTGYSNSKFEKGAEIFTVAYPQNPHVLNALKAYAIAEPFHAHDPHEFYYFDYKRVADREKLPPYCVATDLAALISPDKGQLLLEIHSYFVEKLKLVPHYKDDSIEYYLKKKRVSRFIIDFSSLEVLLILKLKNMDAYIDLVAGLPQNLRSHFENGGCHRCGFQGATDEFCKFRVIWTLDNKTHEACNFGCFHFQNPESKDAELFGKLMAAEYGITCIT